MNRKMNSKKKILSSMLIFTLVLIISTGCSEKEFNFKSSAEALSACKSELDKLRKVKSYDAKELGEEILRWQVMRDSSIAVFMRDTADILNSENAMRFYTITDSVRYEFKRLADIENRSMKELVIFRQASCGEKELKKSEEYKIAKNFFDNMKPTLYKDSKQASKEYIRLLETTKPFEKENDMLSFFIKEDKCFQSLIKDIPSVPIDELKIITEKSDSLFQGIYAITMSGSDDEVTKRVIAFMTYRLNRRIFQNVKECMNTIDVAKKSGENVKNSYRWMIMQPFMVMDNTMIGYMTDSQFEIYKELAERLPEIMNKLDNKNADKIGKEEQKQREKNLSQYLWNLTVVQLM